MYFKISFLVTHLCNNWLSNDNLQLKVLLAGGCLGATFLRTVTWNHQQAFRQTFLGAAIPWSWQQNKEPTYLNMFKWLKNERDLYFILYPVRKIAMDVLGLCYYFGKKKNADGTDVQSGEIGFWKNLIDRLVKFFRLRLLRFWVKATSLWRIFLKGKSLA